jgi:hypothetical protein
MIVFIDSKGENGNSFNEMWCAVNLFKSGSRFLEWMGSVWKEKENGYGKEGELEIDGPAWSRRR